MAQVIYSERALLDFKRIFEFVAIEDPSLASENSRYKHSLLSLSFPPTLFHQKLEAIKNLEDGLSTTDIGSHLFKVRVKREHSGKSSGFRTIIVYQENDKAIFLYGFGKNENQNIDKAELQYFKKLGNDLLALDSKQPKQFMEQKILAGYPLEASAHHI